ncbi:MAG TPA: UDP-N-acetylglucosamine 1-carboxyvinyltransferase [Terriglobia bacterium]|jgi:UDP-N-acetylglucosamine 1-carboxyvinyltransferase|nr:UDP-N-acetylglucosamine 1-carboxyvinyltransferase [Terriglobia bacterium]
MDRFLIEGGVRLAGRVGISGAKNAALPAMAAALLTEQRVVLRNVPRVRDIGTLRSLMEELGVDSSVVHEEHGNRVEIEARRLLNPLAPYELVKQMRASVLVLGPLLARFGHARVSLPGGCAIGARPINLHIRGLERMGARITIDHGYINARADGLKGTSFYFDTISVTGTENLMMAATLAQGETVLENCAREPEVVDLANLLIEMGARITGAGTPTISIHGVGSLHGADHVVIPDRIEAGTFLVAAGITKSHLVLERVEPAHLTAVIAKLSEAGLSIRELSPTELEVHRDGALRPADVTTHEYPGFPTDMQAQYMALMTQAEGSSVITETIFENRFLHALELARMGADITVNGRRAVVRGRTPLSGANVQASDLRASASLVLAGLAAEGETIIDRVYHIDRGYERIEEKLTKVGARIKRISES